MFIPNRILIPATMALALAACFALGLAIPSKPTDYIAVPIMAKTAGHPILSYLPDHGAGPAVTAQAAILIDVASRTVLFAKAERTARAPASTTKILTALVALEQGRLSDIVTISKVAAATPGSTMRLRAGDKLTLGDVLTGMMLRSGNDAAAAVAQYIAGDEKRFSALMNGKALASGARNSHFVNPHGLDRPGHYTTAEDLALITLAAIENPAFAKLVRTKSAQVGTVDAWTRDINNTNQLLWSFEGAEGVKTGTTGQAGQCLVSLATRQGRQLLSVVLGASNRYWDAKRLLSYGFEDFTMVTGAERDEMVDVVDVAKGMKRQVPLIAAKTTQFLVKRGDMDDLELMLHIPTPLMAPLRKGQVIGELVASISGSRLAATPLKVADAVPRRTWWRLVMEWWSVWFRDVISVLCKA